MYLPLWVELNPIQNWPKNPKLNRSQPDPNKPWTLTQNKVLIKPKHERK